MVCKIIPGESFRGAVSYNENKVAEGQASLLMAGNYPVEEGTMTFREKLGVLEKRGDLNSKMDKKVQHIIVAFSPEDKQKLTGEQLRTITTEYMDAIGFGEQPYLVYQHTDTHHPHLHIVTTHVQPDGTPMNTFRIGKYKSNPARIALEEKYGLVRAQDQQKQEAYAPDPVDVEALLYGQVPVKSTVSRIVRFVVKNYHFASLPELNAALKQFNVMADRGAEDTATYRTKGLVYSVIDQEGERKGRAIKASTIYSQPTLEKLEKLFGQKAKRKTEKDRTRLGQQIEASLSSAGGDQKRFTRSLLGQGIYTVFRQNEEGRIYGVTFVDNKTKCVYKGSDIDKIYSAKGILERLATGDRAEILSNRVFVKGTLAGTDYTVGFEGVLSSWIGLGMLVNGYTSAGGAPVYRMGFGLTEAESFTLADRKMSLYFQANGFTPAKAAWLHRRIQKEYRSNAEHEILRLPVDIITGILKEMMMVTQPPNDYVDSRWRQSSRNKKRRRRY